jgi:DNA-binding XRE family transcriptional regulator
MTTEFGALLRKYREEAGVSLAELARQINYSKSQVSKIENGHKRPSMLFARQCDRVLAADGALTTVEAGPQRRLGAVVDLPVPALVGRSNLDAGAGRGALAVAEIPSRSDLAGYLEGHGVPAFGEFSAAAAAAARASTTREFAAACGRLLSEKRLSQGEVARRAGHRLPKSTVNRMVTGASLCQTPDQVLALLDACNASREAEVWLQSWERARVNKRRKSSATDIPPLDETSASAGRGEHTATRGEASSTADSAADVSGHEQTRAPLNRTTAAQRTRTDDTKGSRAAAEPMAEPRPEAGEDSADGDVLLDLRVRVTRQHVRKALPVLAAMGLLDVAADGTTGQLTPAALMAAAGMALIDDAQRIVANHSVRGDVDGQDSGLRVAG